MMMRRTLVDKIGLFDERFGTGSNIPAGEETDYVYRAYAAGAMLEFTPDLLIHHHHGRKTPDEARDVMRNYSIATGAVLAKHFFKDPFTCAPVVWTIKDALIEICHSTKSLQARHRLFLPEFARVLCEGRGALCLRFASAPPRERMTTFAKHRFHSLDGMRGSCAAEIAVSNPALCAGSAHARPSYQNRRDFDSPPNDCQTGCNGNRCTPDPSQRRPRH
jgi:hypothetical protein